MIPKRGFTTVSALANEWLTDRGYDAYIEEDILKRWVSNRSEEMLGTEQLIYSIAILDVVNNKASFPSDAHSIYLAMVISEHRKCWNRESLVGYTEQIYGTDCDVEVNILCPKCQGKTCTCSNAVIDVQVDDLYLQTHPWLWAMTSDKYIGYSAPTMDGFPCDPTPQSFKIMLPRGANAVLWNSEYYVGVCNKIGDPTCYKYEIEDGEFITDMKDGQVMIAYLRYPKDDEGYFLIPNYPIVVRAITAYIDEKFAWREYMNNSNQTARLRWLDAKNESQSLFNQAQSEIDIPDPDKWTRDVKQHWIQDRSRFHYGKP